MTGHDGIVSKIAEALFVDYSNVFYVNAVTNEYIGYAVDADHHILVEDKSGDDFFADLITDSENLVYEDDRHIFVADIQKENLFKKVLNGEMKSIDYRLMIDGKPVWYRLRVMRVNDTKQDEYLVLGVINIDKEVRFSEERKRLEREREKFNQIAVQLASHYSTIFYVDAETDKYVQISDTNLYDILDVPRKGNKFFEESTLNAARVIYSEDRQKIKEVFNKKNLQKLLEEKNVITLDYRIMLNNELVYTRMNAMYTKDRKYFLFCIEDRSREAEIEKELNDANEKNVIFGQIAESLASYYNTIYYVNMDTNRYLEFSATDAYKSLDIATSGADFFEETQKNIKRVIYPDDREFVQKVMNKEYILKQMEGRKMYIAKYRLVINGEARHTKLSIIWARDKKHLIVGVEDIDDQVRREESVNKDLRDARVQAIMDELTGVKNKNAYKEAEDQLQYAMDMGYVSGFAIVVCDLNNLKKINDTLGHKVGDEYIKGASKIICDACKHSSVYRIGGDEFVVLMMGEDYDNRETIMEGIKARVIENLREGDKPVVAVGCSEFRPGRDKKVEDIFDRADVAMYKNKKWLKNDAERQ